MTPPTHPELDALEGWKCAACRSRFHEHVVIIGDSPVVVNCRDYCGECKLTHDLIKRIRQQDEEIARLMGLLSEADQLLSYEGVYQDDGLHHRIDVALKGPQ